MDLIKKVIMAINICQFVIRHRGSWRNIDYVEFATLEWVNWFSNRRVQEPIGNIPPAEFEMAYYRQLRKSTDTVDSRQIVSGKTGAIHNHATASMVG